jgi:hypothetical protein
VPYIPDHSLQRNILLWQYDHIVCRHNVRLQALLVGSPPPTSAPNGSTILCCCCASQHHARPLSAALSQLRDLTYLVLRRSELDLSDNDITSLAGATFAGEIE